MCRTPLHAAARAESVAGLQLVLVQGSEVNAVDHAGHSPLMVAADNGHTSHVGALLLQTEYKNEVSHIDMALYICSFPFFGQETNAFDRLLWSAPIHCTSYP